MSDLLNNLKQNKGAPDSWCPLPWSHISIKGNGFYRVCCHSNVSKECGILKDNQDRPYHIGKADWNEVINSDKMKSIRKNMLAGKWSPECVRCQREFKSDMTARNIRERFLLAENIESKNYPGWLKTKTLTKNDGAVSLKDFPVSFLDIRFGNLCNLRCAMCSPTDSSAWYGEHNAVWGRYFADSGKKITLAQNINGKITTKEKNIFNWSDDPNLWRQIEKYLKQFRRVHIAGGEPLLIKDYFRFLEKCIESGVAEKLIIEFNSNITYIPEKVYDLWKHFKRIHIGISVDGFGPINDFIRYPSKWCQIEKNIQHLDCAGGNISCHIAMSVGSLNIWHLPEFIMYIMKKNYRNIGSRTSLISPHPIYKPGFLNINILEDSFKDEIRSRFKKYKEEISNYDWQSVCGPSHIISWEEKISKACEILDNYTKFMYQISYSSPEEIIKWRSFFIYFMDTLDKLRGWSWRVIFPELYDRTLEWRKLELPKHIKSMEYVDKKSSFHTDRV